MIYNADIAHCSGYLCPIADRCRRAQIFYIWDKMPINKRPAKVSFISTKYDNKSDKCELFMAIK